MEEIKNTYGTSPGVDYMSKLETVENQYAFLKFGKSDAATLKTYCREVNQSQKEGVQRYERIREYREAEPGAYGRKQNYDREL